MKAIPIIAYPTLIVETKLDSSNNVTGLRVSNVQSESVTQRINFNDTTISFEIGDRHLGFFELEDIIEEWAKMKGLV